MQEDVEGVDGIDDQQSTIPKEREEDASQDKSGNQKKGDTRKEKTKEDAGRKKGKQAGNSEQKEKDVNSGKSDGPQTGNSRRNRQENVERKKAIVIPEEESTESPAVAKRACTVVAKEAQNMDNTGPIIMTSGPVHFSESLGRPPPDPPMEKALDVDMDQVPIQPDPQSFETIAPIGNPHIDDPGPIKTNTQGDEEQEMLL